MKDGKYNIEDLRAVINLGALRPVGGETTTFVFDNIDKMSEICQNALLKFIEEPSSNRFVFTAENKAAILPTVLSRTVIDIIEPEAASPESEETAKAVAAALANKNEYETLTAFSRIKDKQSLSEVIKLLTSEIRDALCGRNALSPANAGGLFRAAGVLSEYGKRAELNPNIGIITTALAADLCKEMFA